MNSPIKPTDRELADALSYADKPEIQSAVMSTSAKAVQVLAASVRHSLHLGKEIRAQDIYPVIAWLDGGHDIQSAINELKLIVGLEVTPAVKEVALKVA